MTPAERADADAIRASAGLGRLLVLTVALVLVGYGITHGDGTWLPAIATTAGIALIARLIHVATAPKEQQL